MLQFSIEKKLCKKLAFKKNPQYNPSIKDSWINVKMSGPKNNR